MPTGTVHDGRPSTPGEPGRYPVSSLIGLLLGPVVLLVMLLLPAPGGMPELAWRTAAVGALMAIWWISEAIPIPATALLPLALFPALGISEIEAAATPYANPIIFLFLGGFLLAQAMQRWGLHRRIALALIAVAGSKPVNLIGGFMVAAAFLSMWVSNTATAVMMLPIGTSVIQRLLETRGAEQATEQRNFAIALMLGIAYGCSIGGLGTLIGTPPNALLAGFLADTYGIEVGFGQWMLVGVPLVLVGLPLSWLVLTRWVYPVHLGELPGGRAAIRGELQIMGRLSRGEVTVAIVFALTAAAWILRPLFEAWVPGLSDAGIAILAALVLFVIPVNLRAGLFALNWEWARQTRWDVLILFGGGLSLAAAIAETGLAEWIGAMLGGMEALPLILLVLATAAIIIFLTELTSNTAVAAAFLPILGALAVGMGHSPLLLTVPAALAASCAFMMPVATPPNAIVYGSGYMSIAQMARAGLVLNLLFIALLVLFGYWLAMLVFGVDVSGFSG